MSNSGLRIILDQRDKLFWFSIHERGELHESARGFATAIEAVEQADLYRRLLKLDKHRQREREKRAAENQ
jgi:hypothetical protein